MRLTARSTVRETGETPEKGSELQGRFEEDAIFA